MQNFKWCQINLDFPRIHSILEKYSIDFLHLEKDYNHPSGCLKIIRYSRRIKIVSLCIASHNIRG